MSERLQYEPVPVEVARDVGLRFNKPIVVITTWDETFGCLHTTTWGDQAHHKEIAAEMGPRLAAAAGGDVGQARCFADFRDPSTAAKNAEAAQLAARVVAAAKEFCCWNHEMRRNGCRGPDGHFCYLSDLHAAVMDYERCTATGSSGAGGVPRLHQRPVPPPPPPNETMTHGPPPPKGHEAARAAMHRPDATAPKSAPKSKSKGGAGA